MLLGAGVTIGGASDSFRFVAKPASGNTELTTHLVGQSNMNPLSNELVDASAGIMLRVGTGAGARHVSVLATPQNGVSLRWREADGANTGIVTVPNVQPPVWLRVRRVGNVFTGFYSSNGSTWTALGQPLTLSFPTSLLAGYAANSGTSDQLTRAFFEPVDMAAGDEDTPPPVEEVIVPNRRELRPFTSHSPGAFRADFVEKPRDSISREQ